MIRHCSEKWRYVNEAQMPTVSARMGLQRQEQVLRALHTLQNEREHQETPGEDMTSKRQEEHRKHPYFEHFGNYFFACQFSAVGLFLLLTAVKAFDVRDIILAIILVLIAGILFFIALYHYKTGDAENVICTMRSRR